MRCRIMGSGLLIAVCAAMIVAARPSQAQHDHGGGRGRHGGGSHGGGGWHQAGGWHGGGGGWAGGWHGGGRHQAVGWHGGGWAGHGWRGPVASSRFWDGRVGPVAVAGGGGFHGWGWGPGWAWGSGWGPGWGVGVWPWGGFAIGVSFGVIVAPPLIIAPPPIYAFVPPIVIAPPVISPPPLVAAPAPVAVAPTAPLPPLAPRAARRRVAAADRGAAGTRDRRRRATAGDLRPARLCAGREPRILGFHDYRTWLVERRLCCRRPCDRFSGVRVWSFWSAAWICRDQRRLPRPAGRSVFLGARLGTVLGRRMAWPCR